MLRALEWLTIISQPELRSTLNIKPYTFILDLTFELKSIRSRAHINERLEPVGARELHIIEYF